MVEGHKLGRASTNFWENISTCLEKVWVSDSWITVNTMISANGEQTSHITKKPNVVFSKHLTYQIAWKSPAARVSIVRPVLFYKNMQMD